MRINMAEMKKLVVLLAKNNIPFRIKVWNFLGKPTWQICSPSIADTKVSAVRHAGSYGHERGLIEIMSHFEDEVVGWLTADEALPYFQILKEEIK